LIVAKNLIRASQGKSPNSQLKNILPRAVIVSLGAQNGILAINNAVFPARGATQMKLELLNGHMRVLKGDKAAIAQDKSKLNSMNSAFGCLQCCCCCCACAPQISKKVVENKKRGKDQYQRLPDN